MKMTDCIHCEVCTRHYRRMPTKRGRLAISEECSADCEYYAPSSAAKKGSTQNDNTK